MSETRKFGEFAAGTEVTLMEFIGRQGGANKRFPIAVLQAWIEGLDLGGGGGGSSALAAHRDTDLGVTALTLVEALAWTLPAAGLYQLRAALYVRTTAVDKGIRVAIGGTAGTQSIAATFKMMGNSAAYLVKSTKTKDEALVFGSSAVGGDDNLMEISGLVYATSGGTIQIKIGAAVEFDYCAAQKGSGGLLELIGTVAE